MNNISTTTIRMDKDVKNKLSEQLGKTGLTINSYFNMAARQFLIQGKVPFEIYSESELPNEETERALVEARSKELGIIKDTSKSFGNVNKLMNYLNK